MQAKKINSLKKRAKLNNIQERSGVTIGFLNKNIYIVNVGNIGNIECITKSKAIEVFNLYKEKSIANIGRGAGESIALFENDNIIKEYFGTLDQ